MHRIALHAATGVQRFGGRRPHGRSRMAGGQAGSTTQPLDERAEGGRGEGIEAFFGWCAVSYIVLVCVWAMRRKCEG